MKINTIQVSGFRSMSAISLSECGGFNVLIGKNNSGKSNILLALDTFYSCLRDGEPVFLDPSVGRPIDRFGADSNVPIEIGVIFGMTLAERDNLIQNIVSEAPQVKNAVDGMDPELRLGVLLSIPPSRNLFAYVKRIVLCIDPATAFTENSASRTLLNIDPPAADELARKTMQIRQKERDSSALSEYANQIARQLDEDDWARLKSDSNAPVRRLRYMYPAMHHSAPTSEIQIRVEELIRASETRAAFREAVSVLSNSIIREAQVLREQPLKNRIDSFAGQEDSVPGYARNLIKLIGESKVLYLTERRETIGRREAAQLLELKVKRGGPEKLRYIQETVSALLGVEIDAFQADAKSGNEPTAELDVDRFLVQVNGAGIREALRLILDFEFGRPDVLLVEEPEIHLHPALETSMMRYLKNVGKNSQIFITTHSTNFLDTAEMRNVYLVAKDESTHVQLINASEAEESIPRELGIRLSSLFMFDRLVFVEGPSDEDVFREWASTLGVNLGHLNVGFVPMGGVRNLASYAAERTIAFLTKRQVRMWFVIDRDEREDSEVLHMVQQLGNRAKLHVLKKREIENYLLSCPSLCLLIKAKIGMAGNGIPEKEVTDAAVLRAMNEVAEQLKDVAIERRVVRHACNPLYPDRKAVLDAASGAPLMQRVMADIARQRNELDRIESDLERIVQEHAADVNSTWPGRKFDLIPGDMLLDHICQRFGIRFNKDRDSARLAALMQREEISQEIQDLLREIGKG